ncbi:MAG: hydroxymethylbilane synthase [Thermoguttaceae bacterium]
MLHLGTRASALARWQAEWVASRLREQGVDVVLTPITTRGDRRTAAIAALGGEGVFTKEIQQALLDGRIDLAVHSLKDLPTRPETADLCLAAVPERASPRDVLVASRDVTLESLPEGARIGTGSLRRRAQLLHVRPDFEMCDVRGNVETRLDKWTRGEFDALVLAEAGLRRLGLERHIVQTFSYDVVLPAVGQGALGLETRTADAATRRAVAALNHPPSHLAVLAERAVLASLHGGCLAPIAGFAQSSDDGRLTLVGRVVGRDGVDWLEAEESVACPLGCGGGGYGQLTGESMALAVGLGRRVAELLLTQGAERLIDACRT